nr:hypothetical protein [Tanacetum cinerariifolium]
CSCDDEQSKVQDNGFVKPLVKRKLIHVGSSSRSTRQKSSPASMEAKAESFVYLTISVDEAVDQMKGECEILRERNKVRDKECEEPKAKCEAAMADFDKNPAMMVFRQKTVSLVVEVKEHKGSLDRMLLESQKWVGYQENLATLKSKVADFEAEKRSCKDEGALRSGESERIFTSCASLQSSQPKFCSRLGEGTVLEIMLMCCMPDTTYGPHLIWRISEKSALVVEIDLTWSLGFVYVELEAQISLIMFEFSSCPLADSAINLVSDSSSLGLRSGYEEFSLIQNSTISWMATLASVAVLEGEFDSMRLGVSKSLLLERKFCSGFSNSRTPCHALPETNDNK